MPHFRLSRAKGITTFFFRLSCFNDFAHVLCSWVLYCWGHFGLVAAGIEMQVMPWECKHWLELNGKNGGYHAHLGFQCKLEKGQLYF